MAQQALTMLMMVGMVGLKVLLLLPVIIGGLGLTGPAGRT